MDKSYYLVDRFHVVIAIAVVALPLFAGDDEEKEEKLEISKVFFSPVSAIPPKGSLVVSIPAFDIDEIGLPNRAVVLRIVLKDEESAEGSLIGVRSRIEYRSDDSNVRRDKEEVNLPSLRQSGSGRWIVYRYVFKKTPFQLIRAINGVFTFRVTSSATVPIPIQRAEVEALPEAQAIWIKESQRTASGWKRVLPSDGFSPAKVSLQTDRPQNGQSVIPYARDPMRSVYTWSRPSQSEIGKPVRIVAAPGEIETISFGLYCLADTTVTAILFGFPKEIKKIGEWYREVSDDRAITQSLFTWPTPDEPTGYGNIPDRLERFDKLTLRAGQSVRLWFKFPVPIAFAGRELEGKILILSGQDRIVAMIDAIVSVLPIPLDPSPHMNPVYHDPYVKTFHREQREVWRFLKEFGLDPFFYLDGSRVIVVRDADSRIADLDLSHFESLLDEMRAEGFLKSRLIVESTGWFVEREVKEPYANLYDKLSDPIFKEAYGMLVRKIIAGCANRGVEVLFSITDEPWIREEWMMRANRLATIIRENGGKTLVTYDPHADRWPYRRSDGALIDLGLQALVDCKLWYLMSQGKGFLRNEPHYGYYTTFDAHLRNPIYNRFLHGLLAWRTEAHVVAAYALGSFSVDPFEDFDRIVPDGRWWPDFVFGYPTWKGPFITALNAEGVKEGIKDARYLATLARLVREFPNNPIAAEAEVFLKLLAERVQPDYLKSVYAGKHEERREGTSYRYILEQVSPTGGPDDFEAFTAARESAARFIGALVAGESNLPPNSP